ncbi:hypothetical protein ACF05L_21860 [Streptomyces bobili]|uniref:hypothetical protein n=1 Tax=Streptomyces bobili TaxID=67280 RepID=UPI0036F76A80
MTATVITDLAAELTVPEDGTLSRVLYRDDRLRVVGFAFAAGQELTEHTSTLPVIIQVVAGRLDLVLGEDRTEAGARKLDPSARPAAACGARHRAQCHAADHAARPGAVLIREPVPPRPTPPPPRDLP